MSQDRSTASSKAPCRTSVCGIELEEGDLTYKWVGQTWRRRESGRGSEARRSQDTNDGSPLRVDSSSAGVSMPMPPPPMCSTPARAFAPPPHTFVTANLMPLKSESKYELCGDGDGDGDGRARGDEGFRQSVKHQACVLRQGARGGLQPALGMKERGAWRGICGGCSRGEWGRWWCVSFTAAAGEAVLGAAGRRRRRYR
jgi:hypothetical protein